METTQSMVDLLSQAWQLVSSDNVNDDASPWQQSSNVDVSDTSLWQQTPNVDVNDTQPWQQTHSVDVDGLPWQRTHSVDTDELPWRQADFVDVGCELPWQKTEPLHTVDYVATDELPLRQADSVDVGDELPLRQDDSVDVGDELPWRQADSVDVGDELPWKQTEPVDIDDVTPSVFHTPPSGFNIAQYMDFTPECSTLIPQFTPDGSNVQSSPESDISIDLVDPVLRPEASPESGFYGSSDGESLTLSPVLADELEGSLTELLQQLRPLPTETHQKPNNTSPKPATTYMELISKAILSAPGHRMMIGDIYDYILRSHPYYSTARSTWRNAVRHNLSSHEFFIKRGRADNGRGYFWTIHPANIKAFSNGDFRRREACLRVRHACMAKPRQPVKMEDPPLYCSVPVSMMPAYRTVPIYHVPAAMHSQQDYSPAYHQPEPWSTYHQEAAHYYNRHEYHNYGY